MKKVICSVIETPNNGWTVWRDVKRNLEKIEFPDVIEICNNINQILGVENIEIIDRIGSPSADGEVYRIRYKGVEYALKLMPRVDDESEIRNKNEIETANLASQYPEYFPMTFASGYCPNSYYYLTENRQFSSFIPRAIQYSNLTNFLNTLDKKSRKRVESEFRNAENKEDFFKKYNFKISNTIQVDFLISELACCDFGNWMMQERTINEWKKILIDIVTAAYYMPVVLKKVHPDLHPGNILITNTGILLHDFGRAYTIDETIPEMYRATLMSFCSEFMSCSTRSDLIIPPQVLSAIQEIYITIQKEGNIREIYYASIYLTILAIV